MTFQISSSAFEAGQPVPKKHTGDGVDVSPPLTWSSLPEGTAELALICDDPDAPTAEPWVHWVIYKIPAGSAGAAREGGAGPEPESRSRGYAGSQFVVCPVARSVTAGPLHLPATAPTTTTSPSTPSMGRSRRSPSLTKAGLLAAMAGHVLAEAELVGTYAR